MIRQYGKGLSEEGNSFSVDHRQVQESESLAEMVWRAVDGDEALGEDPGDDGVSVPVVGLMRLAKSPLVTSRPCSM